MATPTAADEEVRRDLMRRMDHLLSGLPGRLCIGAYGSFVTGLYTPDGDIDLSVEGQALR